MLVLALMLAPLTTARVTQRSVRFGSRRLALRFGLMTAASARLPAHAEVTTPWTAMDAFQLSASYRGLEEALSSWGAEVALVQLGQEPATSLALNGLNDAQLKHFAQAGAMQATASFEKHRSSVLTFLYLARGASRYEKNVDVALDYIEKAKSEVEAARSDLAEIAEIARIPLKQNQKASSTQAELQPTFVDGSKQKKPNIIVLP